MHKRALCMTYIIYFIGNLMVHYELFTLGIVDTSLNYYIFIVFEGNHHYYTNHINDVEKKPKLRNKVL